jgi:hypothetical protein
MFQNIASYIVSLLKKTCLYRIISRCFLILILIFNSSILLANNNAELLSGQYIIGGNNTAEQVIENYTKQNNLSVIINNLNKMENLYNNYIDNNTGLPAKINASLQMASLTIISELNKYKKEDLSFIKLYEIEDILKNIIQQEDATKVFVFTSHGSKKNDHQLSSKDTEINIIENQAQYNLDNWIPLKLVSYDKNTKENVSLVSMDLIKNDNDIVTAKKEVQDFITKYNDKNNYELTLHYSEIVFKDSCFNHKTTTIPHSSAVYFRIKDKVLTIFIVDPASAGKDYNNICPKNEIKEITWRLIKDKIPYNIYTIPLNIQNYGASCMMHSYEICKEMLKNDDVFKNFCLLPQNDSNIKDNYRYIYNNIPISFFNTLHNLDLLENIVENQNEERQAAIKLLRHNLQTYYKDNFIFFSVATSRIGIYNIEHHKDIFREKHKVLYPEVEDSCDCAGYYQNVNTLTVASLLELIKTIKCDLTNNKITSRLTEDSLSIILDAIADIKTINNDSLQQVLEYTISMKEQYNDSNHYYYLFENSDNISNLIDNYNKIIEKLEIFLDKDEIEIYINNIHSNHEYSKIDATSINFYQYISQLKGYHRHELEKYITLINEKFNNNDFFISDIDKKEIINRAEIMEKELNTVLININNDIENVYHNAIVSDKSTSFTEEDKELTAFLKYEDNYLGLNYRRGIIKNIVNRLRNEINQDSSTFLYYIIKTKQKNSHNAVMRSVT